MRKIFLLGLFSSPLLLSAQELTSNTSQSNMLFWGILITTAIVVLAAIITLYAAILILAKEIKKEIAILKGQSIIESEKEKATWLSNFWKKFEKEMTDAVPIEKEADVQLDHNYDGIKELDNNLPPWWKYMFYLTIVFSVVYLFHFHVSGSGKLSLDEYKDELKLAEEAKTAYLAKAANLIDENNVTVNTDQSAIANGSQIFSANCKVCHGASGEGGVGPNMTDDYWIHGGGINNIFKTIKYGVPEKGMISWQAQLRPKDIQDVASYIISLRGTNPANAKEPQGELFASEDKTTIAVDSNIVSSNDTMSSVEL